MAIVKAVVGIYRTVEEKPLERYKAKIQMSEDHKYTASFKSILIDFLGLNDQANKFGLWLFDLKRYRLAKVNSKAKNYVISTQQQLELELPFLPGLDGESELNVCNRLRQHLKGVIKAYNEIGGAKYFTHRSSYYPVPDTGMSLADMYFTSLLPPNTLCKENMKTWMESYRPVRQRTVRCETTKDKAGALPPAVYTQPNPKKTKVNFQAEKSNQTTPTEIRSVVGEVCAVTFVNDVTVPHLTLGSAADFNQVEEYETDSEDSDDNLAVESEELVTSRAVITRSGRQVKAWTRFDV